MQALPEPVFAQLIPTRFGDAQTYIFQARSEQRVPILLIPGRASGTPMWRENLPHLLAERDVIAFDALGDAGLSEQRQVIRGDADQAAYIADVLNALQVDKVHVVGHSFGGWMAANFALHHPERVASLSLLEPVFVVQGLRADMWVKISAMLLLQGVPVLGERLAAQVQQDIGGSEAEEDLSDPLAQMIAHGSRFYSSGLPQPRLWTPDDLSRLKMPVFVALGEQSALHDAAAGAAVAHGAMPHAQVKVWPGGTHSLPMQMAPALDRELLKFMAEQD